MRRRQRHRLDMLPLLDVFMVVLFVFATIQEDRLDASRALSKRLQAQLANEAGREVEAVARLERERAAARAQADDAREGAAKAERRVKTLEAALAEVRHKADTVAKRASPSIDEALRRQEVLSKLLDHFTVFEVEVAGRTEEDGSIVNHCCFRADPHTDQWNPCGTVPHRTAELDEWLEQGAGGLLAALRRTKGGNAMTIIRQDETATFRIAGTLESALRDRFSGHKIYNEGIALEASLCTSSPPGPR